MRQCLANPGPRNLAALRTLSLTLSPAHTADEMAGDNAQGLRQLQPGTENISFLLPVPEFSKNGSPPRLPSSGHRTWYAAQGKSQSPVGGRCVFSWWAVAGSTRYLLHILSLRLLSRSFSNYQNASYPSWLKLKYHFLCKMLTDLDSTKFELVLLFSFCLILC